MCHFKGNTSLDSQTITLFSHYVLIISQIRRSLHIGGSHLKPFHTRILITSTDFTVRVRAINFKIIEESHVWLTVCPSVQKLELRRHLRFWDLLATLVVQNLRLIDWHRLWKIYTITTNIHVVKAIGNRSVLKSNLEEMFLFF